MCIIAIKPKGVKMPPKHYIENMWYHNHDGAGFMYANGKNVVIDKGYMDLDSFEKALDKLGEKRNLTDTALVMHFRIGTAGGNIPANTHPFPISDSIPVLQKLTCTTSLGIVHNGIIPITPRQKDISDTMEFIAGQLAPLYRYDHEFYKSKDILQMIAAATTSKLAFMNPKGEIFTVGNFITDDGIMYSNSSYSYMTYYRSGLTKCYGYLPYYDDDYDELEYGHNKSGSKEQGEYPISWSREMDMYVDKLMMLEKGEYVVDYDTGKFFSSDDATMFMDEDGFIYLYDDFTQTAYMVTNQVGVFSAEGMPLKYDEQRAADMVIDNNELVDLEDFYDFEFEELIEPLNDEEKKKAAAEEDEAESDMPF